MKNKIINGLLILVAIAFFFYGLTQQIAAEREAAFSVACQQESLNLKTRLDECEKSR